MGVPGYLLKGKTPEQKKVVKYFADNGCLSLFTRMKDDIYEQMVLDKLNSLNLKQKALGKIGLDEDQLKEIPPVLLHGYNYKDADYTRVGKDDRARSSKYDAYWLFFSSTQVYLYGYTFDMTSDSKKERTEEYFYKDITNFSTSSESIDANKPKGCFGGTTKVTKEYSQFSLIVPGDKFTCPTTGVPNADESVSAMKQKLREKKS